MKTKHILLALVSATLLASCGQYQITKVPQAAPVSRLHAPVQNGNRYTATWGGDVVHWVDSVNGHRWTCTYKEFFAYCGGKHPSAKGITVKGKLPASVTSPAPAAAPAPTVASSVRTGSEPIPFEVP